MFTILFILSTIPKVYYWGDTLDYKWEEEIIYLIGDAKLKTPDVMVKADTIKYASKDNIVSASGNPILWVGDQEIAGKRMKYDLNTGEGIIEDGRTQIKNGWFDGRIMRKVGPKTLNIDYGKFTTCSLNPLRGEPPHYYFWGRRLKVYVDDMVFTQPLVLLVKGIPLFIAPFWWFPIKKGRQSGFLYPKVGRSESDGRYVKNISYYWVTNDWSDVTFTLDYLEKRGPRAGVEGRWLISPCGAGNLNASYIVEQQEEVQPQRKRWSLDFIHSQDFGRRLSLRTSGNFISDAQYKVDYEEQRLVQIDKILTSYLSVTKSWDLGGTNFILQERRDLTSDARETLLPRLTYSLNPKNILGSYFSYSGGFTNSSAGEEYEQQSDNTFSISFPFKLMRYISISPATTHTFTFKRPEPLEEPHHYRHSVSLTTNLYGRSIFPAIGGSASGGNPEFRHIMTPGISYSIVDKERSCSFSLSNNFQLLLFEKLIQLARLNLTSSWDFDQHRINPVDIALYSTPIPLLDLQAYGVYKHYEDHKFEFSRLVMSSHFVRKDFSISMTYNWAPKWDQSLWGTLDMKLTTNWRLSLSRRYDFREGKTISESFTLYRDLHCWDMEFNFDRYGERWRYDFKLKLKAIPEIQVGKTLFGIFL